MDEILKTHYRAKFVLIQDPRSCSNALWLFPLGVFEEQGFCNSSRDLHDLNCWIWHEVYVLRNNQGMVLKASHLGHTMLLSPLYRKGSLMIVDMLKVRVREWLRTANNPSNRYWGNHTDLDWTSKIAVQIYHLWRIQEVHVTSLGARWVNNLAPLINWKFNLL